MQSRSQTKVLSMPTHNLRADVRIQIGLLITFNELDSCSANEEEFSYYDNLSVISVLVFKH